MEEEVKNEVEREELKAELFWGLAMVVTYSSCWYFVALVSSDFYTTPVVMSVETRATSSWSIPSPAVTVCTSSHISHAKVDVSALYKETNLNDSMKARLDVVRNLCGHAGGGSDYLDDEALTHVIKNYLPDVRNVFISVTRMHKNIEPLPAHLQTIITPSSICFVHNMLPLEAFLRPEFLEVYKKYGLLDGKRVDHNVWTPDLGYQSERYDALPLRLWGNAYSSSTRYLLSVRDNDYDDVCSFNNRAFSIYLHNPAEIPWRVHSNIFLKTNYRVMVFITPVVTSTDDVVKVWNPMKRGCYFERERYLRYFHIYTQRNCERECDSNNTYANCGCVSFSHPRNLSMPLCGHSRLLCVEKSQSMMIKQEMRLKGKDNCQCLPSCNEIDYFPEIHWRPWEFMVNSSFATIPGKVDLNTTSISLLAIAVKKKYMNMTKRTALMGSAAYVASIGGILSLFLGISVLSLFEVLYFITFRAITNIWNVYKQEHQLEMNQRTLWAFRSRKNPFIP
ncbi:pickpocket protein 28-like [Macrosteles quadrilineatus]|uniref:pickpocket protein 28-like n=1 Tax=Macrosteles quadrilineatus TaxID=74068 RepID=UPI0023E1D1BB|nr:pickpocket protein 28-like [Macrosteles quadrilineatus]